MSGRTPSRREVVIGGAAGLVFPDWCAVRAAPITLPDPYTKPPAIVQQSPNPIVLVSPLQARTTATTAVNQVTQIANKASNAFKQVKAVEKVIQETDNQIKDLEDRKRVALTEMRRGEYCSKCERSRSEVERVEKVSFLQHLMTVGGKGVPASPELLAKKAAEYDVQIEPLQKLQPQRRENAQKIRSHIADIQHQIHEGIAMWRAASITDRALTAAREEESRRVDQKELSAAQARLAGLIDEAGNVVGNPKSTQAAQTDMERQTLRSLVASIENRARARQVGYWREVEEMQANTGRQERELSKATKAFIDGGDFRASQIPKFNIAIKPWSMNMSEEQIGAKFQANAILSIGYEAKLDRDAQSIEAKSFIELFGKVKIYGGLLTEDGGIKLTPIIGLDLPEIGSLKEKPKLKMETPTTGEWKKSLPIP